MIKTGRYFIDIKFEDFIVSVNNFKRLLIVCDNTVDVSLPMFELELLVNDLAIFLSKVKDIKFNKKIAITYGQTQDTSITTKFVVINYKINLVSGKYSVVLTGVAEAIKFTSLAYQQSYKDKLSTEVFKEFQYIDVDIKSEPSDDKMTWICPNIPEKELARHLLNYSYIDGSNFLLATITLENKLKVRSLSKILSSPKPFIFSSEGSSVDKAAGMNYKDFSFETANGLTNFMVGAGFSGSTTDISGQYNMSSLPSSLSRITKKPQYSLDIPIWNINCVSSSGIDNVHMRYHDSFFNNIKSREILKLNNINISTTDYISPEKLSVLDPIIFYLPSTTSDLCPEVQGKYIVTKIVYVFTEDDYGQVIRGSRDYSIKGG